MAAASPFSAPVVSEQCLTATREGWSCRVSALAVGAGTRGAHLLVSCNSARRLKLLCLSPAGEVFGMILQHARSRKSVQKIVTVCVRPMGQIGFC